jgi:hypothetical protein
MSTQVERITAVEVRLAVLERKVDNMDAKLDTLIMLRNKGAGVIWLLSGLLGTGIIGGFMQLYHWFGAK